MDKVTRLQQFIKEDEARALKTAQDNLEVCLEYIDRMQNKLKRADSRENHSIIGKNWLQPILQKIDDLYGSIEEEAAHIEMARDEI